LVSILEQGAPARHSNPPFPWRAPQVETTVQEEDTQPITQPIIAPIKHKEFDVVEPKIPETKYKTEFLLSLVR